MSNEEMILEKLSQMSSEIDTLKAKVEKLEYNEKRPTAEQQLKAIDGLSKLLDENEKSAFGAFMDAERVRKERFDYTKWHQNFVDDIQNDKDLDNLLQKTKEYRDKQKKIKISAN